jgi:hypothetical protein
VAEVCGSGEALTWAGATWCFTRDSDRWVQANRKTTAPIVLGADPRYGSTVALSADATTALVGGAYEDNNRAPYGAYRLLP